jgi:hypothetical protein
MKFNTKKTTTSVLESRGDVTTNFEGGIAFNVSKKLELYLRVASAMVGEPKFYTSATQSDKELKDLIREVTELDPKFVFNLAAYVRHNLYLRTVPIMLLVEAANLPSGKGHNDFSKIVTSTIQRPDEITEMLAYQFQLNSHNEKARAHVPMVLKKGLSRAFYNFDEYQFGKYLGDGSSVSLKDAMCVVHPKPLNKDMADVFERIINKKVVNSSWNANIMREGSTKENWEKEIPDMGYMALLRNLNNFLKFGIEPELYMSRIVDERAIRSSKQFPYRFYTAHSIVKTRKYDVATENVNVVLKGLEKALQISLNNVPKLGGITFTSIDVSGSMTVALSEKSVVSRAQVASLYGSILDYISTKSIISAFGTDFAVIPMGGSSILQNIESVTEQHLGHSTNGWKAIRYLNDNKKFVDRVVLFSDMVLYNTSAYGSESFVKEFLKYQRNINPNVFVYLVDLAGYGLATLPEGHKNVVNVAGYSDKIFNYISLFETNRETMIQEIENFKIPTTKI